MKSLDQSRLPLATTSLICEYQYLNSDNFRFLNSNQLDGTFPSAFGQGQFLYLQTLLFQYIISLTFHRDLSNNYMSGSLFSLNLTALLQWYFVLVARNSLPLSNLSNNCFELKPAMCGSQIRRAIDNNVTAFCHSRMDSTHYSVFWAHD